MQFQSAAFLSLFAQNNVYCNNVLFVLQHKPRKKNATDEPECIALSSDEDDDDEDMDEEGDENHDQNGEGTFS